MLYEDDNTDDGTSSNRVQELEEKIKKLENENQKLTKTASHQNHDSNSKTLLPLEEDELENGLLNIDAMLNGMGELDEDEWLFISPKLPPTPVQKKVTPRQWLSDGHYRQGENSTELLSLDDVRKNLMYNIDEAESLNDIINYENSDEKSRETHQRPLNKMRRSRASETLGTNSLTNGESEVVPVVKWKAAKSTHTPTSSPEHSSEETPHQRKWRVKQVPSQSSGLSVKSNGSYDIDPQEAEMPVEDSQHSDDVPVIRWKAKKVPEEDSQHSDDVPVVKWKAKKVPEEDSQHSDNIPVVKWKAKKVPEEDLQHSDDVPVVKWKAKKVPEEDLQHSDDVPVVKWKAKKVPEEDSQHSDNVPVVKWKGKKVPEEDLQHSDDVPVVKWKAKKVPEEDSQHSDNVPVVKWKGKKVPEEDSQHSDVPVVKWKAKQVPEEDSQHSDDVPVVKWKAKKVPEEDSQHSDVPVVKWKAKKVPEKQPQHSDVPVVKQKANSSSAKGLPKVNKNQARVAKIPAGDKSVHHEPSNVHPVDKKPQSLQKSRSHQLPSPSSPALSPVHSLSHQTQDNSETPRKSHSRRSSISDSRSPSPPSISPQVRMAIASPILSRRTPSPSRGLAGGGPRQSPSSSTAMHPKQLQYLGGGQHSSLASRPPSGTGSVGHGSRIRTPRSQSASGVKTGSPMKGLTPPSDRKQKRVLPTPPSSAESPGRSRTRVKQVKPTGGSGGVASQRPREQTLPSGGQDAAGDDDDSWLEGCF